MGDLLLDAGARPAAPLPGPAALLRLGRAFAGTALALGESRLPLPSGRLLRRWSRRLLRALRIQVEVEGPLPAGCPLWAANHLSWIDPLVLLSLRPMGALAKHDVAGYPFIGPAARRVGLRLVDRQDPLGRAAAVAALAREMRSGRDFLIFPEGTTTRGRHLAVLHTGGLLTAHRLGVRTLPLRLDCEAAHYPWTGDETLLPHLVGLSRRPPLTVRVQPGPALDPSELADPFEWLAHLRKHLAPRQVPSLEPAI